MRLYKRSEFLKLPEGIIYSSGPRHADYLFPAIFIKLKSLPLINYFFKQNITWIDGINTIDTNEKLEKMLENNLSYPIEKKGHQDGMFSSEDEEFFLVFEPDDLRYLIGKFGEAISSWCAYEHGIEENDR